MRNKATTILPAALAFAAIAWAGGSGSGDTRTQDTPQPCCYTHLDYAGLCEVTPGEGESCASILQYLNQPMSTGKSYCGGTTIRGGWEPAACEDP